MQIRPGSMYPLGASYDGAGVNFALYSQVAQKVELCLFDEHDAETRIEMTEQRIAETVQINRPFGDHKDVAAFQKHL